MGLMVMMDKVGEPSALPADNVFKNNPDVIEAPVLLRNTGLRYLSRRDRRLVEKEPPEPAFRKNASYENISPKEQGPVSFSIFHFQFFIPQPGY